MAQAYFPSSILIHFHLHILCSSIVRLAVFCTQVIWFLSCVPLLLQRPLLEMIFSVLHLLSPPSQTFPLCLANSSPTLTQMTHLKIQF